MKAFSRALLVLLSLVFSISYGHASSGEKHDLAICAFFKNEAPWLKEWIEYHKSIGVTKFYLYNNDSSDSHLEVLKPYVSDGSVEVFDWSSSDPSHAIYGYDDYIWVPFQYGAYNDCLKNKVNNTCLWLAIIDIDEFVVPMEGASSLLNYLNEKKLENRVGALLLRWRCYGTSHVEKLEDGELLIEKLTMRSADDHPWNHHTKGIYRPDAVEFVGIHGPVRMKRRCDCSLA